MDALTKQQTFDWESLKDKGRFSVPGPLRPTPAILPVEPLASDPRFVVDTVKVTLKLIDWVIPGRRRKRIYDAKIEEDRKRADAVGRFSRVHSEWKQLCQKIGRENEIAQSEFETALANWKQEAHDFMERQRGYNLGVDEFHFQYLRQSTEALIRYWHEVLTRSAYPDSFPRDCSLSFDPASRILVLDYELPNQGAVSNKKQVKYMASRQEFQDVFLSDSEFRHLYDDVLYRICLKTLYELFQADDVNVVDSVVFNGWVRSIDKATGADTHPCVMTVHVTKAEFMALNLAQIDLKACFRALKGISGGRLVDLAPVRPVLTLNRDDPRFVGSYDVAGTLDDKTNLAAMDWLDFENLIRELFEKEFKRNGGEVKITQASRDGGVDAIAFDPDPIRGGKIVIQAKRYTNTVGVSAVRDLYGTVHNEGATKGILVTTSDYGPDAYEFARGKPLTLLSGSELLYLLSRHGYAAKIDLREAKKLLEEKDQ
ncbi:MAG TPA: restriction endonuclease [Candidatus Acidoferrales bacterium]|nr:restriction endonuclease [Candidatus Acidoferrales bacterium]